MNCKPGDIAIMTYGPNRDKLFKVLYRTEYSGPKWEWEVEGLSTFMNVITRHIRPAGSQALASDKYLRPIRNPGDEAMDETLLYAGLPPRHWTEDEKISFKGIE